jgi:hypothetical protein
MYKLLKPLKIFSFETLLSSIKVNVRVQACDQASTAINSIQTQFMFRKEVKSELEFEKFLLVSKKKYLKLNFNCPGGSLRTDYARNADSTESGPTIMSWNVKM